MCSNIAAMSELAISPPAERGAALLRGIAARVEDLRTLMHVQLSGAELRDLARGTEAVARSLFAVQVAQAAEVDQRGMAAALGCPSTALLLRQLLRIPAAQARARVRAARATHPQGLPSGAHTPPVLPLLAAALDAGQLDEAHVAVVATMHALPDTLEEPVRIEAEQQLVGYAVDFDPDQFRKVAAHLVEVLQPDGAAPNQNQAHGRAELHLGTRNPATGLTPLTGRLDDLSVETLRTAIDGLAAPTPTVDGIPDPRPAATRRAHALVEVLRRALAHADLPTHGGRRPQVTVTLNWDVLRGHAGNAVTDDGVTLSPAATRQLLCDAQVIPAVLGGPSQVLDLGRTRRTFPPALRHAIALRDRGCAFPGCDRPPSWTDVHHLRFWDRDLGPTSIANGCLLCSHHHTQIHQQHWHARMAPDGIPEFVPPPWLDPGQHPRRNTVHQVAPDTGEP